MRKLAIALAGAAAVTFASAAQATIFVNPVGTTVQLNDYYDTGTSGYVNYQKAPTTHDGFTDTLTFFNDLAGTYNFGVSTLASAAVTFSSITLSGAGLPGGTVTFDGPSALDNYISYALGPVTLDANASYVVTLTGNAPLGTTFQGTLNWNAVPEPATWAMMLIGFGAIGASIRRRRTRVAVRQFA
jgi:hypothetical protein